MKKTILRDLSLGESAEQFIINLYEFMGYPSSKNNDKKTRSFYDIVSKNKKVEFTTEVKYDIYANRSGNIAIETFNPKSGKPSGLGITKADLWVHITDQPYVTSVKALKKYVDNNDPFKIIPCGGDDNATLYLYKANIILEAIFKPLPNDISKRVGQKIITTFLGV